METYSASGVAVVVVVVVAVVVVEVVAVAAAAAVAAELGPAPVLALVLGPVLELEPVHGLGLVVVDVAEPVAAVVVSARRYQ